MPESASLGAFAHFEPPTKKKIIAEFYSSKAYEIFLSEPEFLLSKSI